MPPLLDRTLRVANADETPAQLAAEPEPKVVRLPAKRARGALSWGCRTGMGGIKSNGATTRTALTRTRLPGGGK